jgi:RecA-family ATPase
VQLTPYMQAAIGGELAKLTSCMSEQDVTMNTTAFNLAAMVKGWELDEHDIRAQFLAACKTLPDLKSANGKGKWTLKQFEDKWRNGMRDAEPRAMPANGAAGTHNTAYVSTKTVSRTNKTLSRTPKLSGVGLPNWTPPGEDGKPKFEGIGQSEPSRIDGEMRRHLYVRDGKSVRCKIKYVRKDGSASWVDYYRVQNKGGRTGWQLKRPEGYVETPYTLQGMDPFDPERKDDYLAWCEGEKDADELSREGIPAISFGSASQIVSPFEELKGRKIVIFGDNDDAGRKFAKRQAELILDMVASVKVYTFPDLPAGGDVTDYVAAHGIEALIKIVDGLPEVTDETYSCGSEVQLRKKPAPERLWLVPQWVPWRDVTAIGADGGVGKTTIALQLARACAAGELWLGHVTRKCPVVYFSAEDDKDELHYRLEKIAAQMLHPDPLDSLHLVYQAGKSATLAIPGPDGEMVPTSLFERLDTHIAKVKAGLAVLDSTADVFGGNENDRSNVRSFITLLRGLAIKHCCAIVILVHPSVDALKTGRGYSGSTHWNNSVRSRMYFTYVTVGDGDEEPDPDLRLLDLPKANRARKGLKMVLRWRADAFQREDREEQSSLDGLQQALKCEATFINLVAEFERQGRTASPNAGRAYAPFLFSKHPEGKLFGAKKYAEAMEILLSSNRVKVGLTPGPKSKAYQTLKVSES